MYTHKNRRCSVQTCTARRHSHWGRNYVAPDMKASDMLITITGTNHYLKLFCQLFDVIKLVIFVVIVVLFLNYRFRSVQWIYGWLVFSFVAHKWNIFQFSLGLLYRGFNCLSFSHSCVNQRHSAPLFSLFPLKIMLFWNIYEVKSDFTSFAISIYNVCVYK